MRRKERAGIRAMKNKTPGGSIIRNTVYAHLAAFILSSLSATMDQVAVLSQKVWSFCDRHGCDPRRRYLMSLSVEEMVGNVIQHGFTKDKKRHHIDVRILKNKEDYIVRIRDDCAFFDPIERLQLYSERDPLHHVGLRMISKTAKSIQYTCVLKLNNLVVRI